MRSLYGVRSPLVIIKVSILLSLVRSLKSPPHPQVNTYEQLLERIDYLEAIIGIRKGLESFDRGEGIPVDRAMTALQQQFNIPQSL
ncbi:MAG: prevent-host-death family protein [Oscillatoriales cyanobacterium]|nr:MAG: prevent-host-death family protein [Oscillatoriales cyanobacterium]